MFKSFLSAGLLVCLASGFGIDSACGQPRSLEDVTFESFEIKNGQMGHVCGAFRRLGVPLSLHGVSAHSHFDAGRNKLDQVYVDNEGRIAFFAGAEPLLTFSLKGCSGIDVLNEACRVSGHYKWSKSNDHPTVLKKDSELETIRCSTPRFHGRLFDYYQINRQHLKFYPGRRPSGSLMAVVDIPEIQEKTLRETFDILARANSLSWYWNFDSHLGFGFHVADPPQVEIRTVSIQYPQLRISGYEEGVTKSDVPYRIVVEPLSKGLGTIIVQLRDDRSVEEKRFDELQALMDAPVPKFTDNTKRPGIPIEEVQGDHLKPSQLAGIWKRTQPTAESARFPNETMIGIVDSPEMATRCPKAVLDYIKISAITEPVYAAGYLDDGIIRGPFVMLKVDDQTSSIFAWEEPNDGAEISRLGEGFLRRMTVTMRTNNESSKEELVIEAYKKKSTFVKFGGAAPKP